jgi:MoaA/NifB/PqqE/SkfB family radical SAM enzyme
MSMETFEAALRWEPQALLNFGGGEPTCHPLFWEFMGVALRRRGEGHVWIATNGKRKQHALLLAGMLRDGVIKGTLSQDEWHEPISRDVVDAFMSLRASNKRVIRNIGRRGLDPIFQGRCDWGHRVDCNGCGMPFVQWDGKVRQCACLDAPVIGDVFGGYQPMFEGAKRWQCAYGLPDPNRR